MHYPTWNDLAQSLNMLSQILYVFHTRFITYQRMTVFTITKSYESQNAVLDSSKSHLAFQELLLFVECQVSDDAVSKSRYDVHTFHTCKQNEFYEHPPIESRE